MDYHRDKDYVSFEKTFRNIFRKRLNLINKYIINPGKVLDIGCSNGIFLDLFKEAGWETWGVEPSSNAQIAGKKGHKIIASTFEKSELPARYFDLVILNHTLEHLNNPTAVLKKIKSVLRPKERVYIDVPNVGSLSSRILGKRWPYLLPQEHKWQYTRASLGKLLESTGFKIVHWESRSGVFEYANPLLEVYRKRFLLDILTIPYSLIASAFRMGDSMSFIAVKK
jgi:2-polyprenyl-3-methyl-5-hydroxy-6-metoxy-1,4-benzoquinol methylase